MPDQPETISSLVNLEARFNSAAKVIAVIKGEKFGQYINRRLAEAIAEDARIVLDTSVDNVLDEILTQE